MITYDQKETVIKVRNTGLIVGEIKHIEGLRGYWYQDLSGSRGREFDTLAECKQSLEAE